jgi:hypothetical protein
MPFLMRKSAAMETESLARSDFQIGNGTAWEDDAYRPSKQGLGLNGMGLPASLAHTPARRLCGSVECMSGWTTPWRNRRRPIFEAQWGCSGRCVLAMVRAAVRREAGNGGEFETATPHRHRVPMGLLMLAQGWITHAQLRKALEMQRESGTGRIGDWLVSQCHVDTEHITRALSMQWGCPVLKTEGFSPEEMALVMPKLFVERFGMLPIRVAGSRILYLGFADRLNASIALALEQMTGLKVESGGVDGTQLEMARKRLLACDAVEVKLETAGDKDGMAARITAILEQKQPIASRLVRFQEHYWLRLWLESGALGKTGSVPVRAEDVKDYLFTAGLPV